MVGFRMSAPLVSVVVPMHNAAATIEGAVASLLQQTWRPMEIIIVDDGSSDDSVAIVERIKNPCVRVFRQPHGGVAKALNLGCSHAHGIYVARLDADDVAHPERLTVQVHYLERHADVGLVGSYARLETSDGRTYQFQPPTQDHSLRRYLLWDNPFVHSSVMFRYAAYREAGGYPEGPNEDYRLWIRMACRWKLAVIPRVLVTYRVLPHSYSRRPRAWALRARLDAQLEAARLLGRWWEAIPPLAATCGAYMLARAYGPADAAVGTLTRRITAHARGIQKLR
ncbi:MAG: glycosyltransferase [Armatimonadota bacterium]|nr:glycosyltransferase [Armatimonadota bacterium]